MLKDFSAACRRWPCHSQAPAVLRVSRPALLKSHADSECGAVVRGQRHAGHRLGRSSETPTESNVVHDNFFFPFLWLHVSVGKDTVASDSPRDTKITVLAVIGRFFSYIIYIYIHTTSKRDSVIVTH